MACSLLMMLTPSSQFGDWLRDRDSEGDRRAKSEAVAMVDVPGQKAGMDFWKGSRALEVDGGFRIFDSRAVLLLRNFIPPACGSRSTQ